MRERRKLFDALGLRGFMTFVIGGNALVALAHPVRTRLGANAVNGRAPGFYPPTALLSRRSGVGLLRMRGFRFLGLRQRRMLDKAIVLVLTPVHWLLLSVAVRGLGAYFFRPPLEEDRTRARQSLTRERENSCAAQA